MMQMAIDMVGRRVGLLVVESRAQDYVDPTSGARTARWLCRCDCGGESVVRGTALRRGSTTSCGCARKVALQGKGLIDLSGQRFGSWTVIERAENGKSRKSRWSCVCDCGTTRVVDGFALRNGASQSCGCGKSRSLRVDRDLVGQVFGRWTVVSSVGAEGESTARSRVWLCRCVCGVQREVSEHSLVCGVSVSCGCYRKERAEAAWNKKAADLTGQRFGLWTALRRYDVRHYRGGGQTIRWWCRCECGVEQAVLVGALRDGTSQSCGCATGSRMEGHVRRFCLEHGVPFTPQRRFPDLRGSGGRPLAFDFEVLTPSGVVLIECQGEQHFRSIEWFGGDEKFVEQQKNDQAKRAYAEMSGIPLVEIHYRVNTYEAVVDELIRRLSSSWEDAGVASPWQKGDDDAAV